ncbi:MAG: hypothetical protein A4E30_00291 [Methanomassiliicoccales archaeon PtaB.Bin215]|nr:MAG: hypothetical protein A4E30_00291 [Methanomassiliicoccales archaeon PtaB.Bin215]
MVSHDFSEKAKKSKEYRENSILSDKTPNTKFRCDLPKSEESIEIMIAVLKQIKRDIAERIE